MSTRHLAQRARIAMTIKAQQKDQPGYAMATLAGVISDELAELAREEAAQAEKEKGQYGLYQSNRP